MRTSLALLLLGVIAKSGVAQKPVLDTTVFARWPSVYGGTLSNDGNYFAYFIRNQPVGSQTLVLRATHGNWKRELSGIGSGSLTQDSRLAVYVAPHDSLCIVALGTSAVECVPQVSAFKLVPRGIIGDWLVYQLNTPAKTLVVRDLVTAKEISYASVTDYVLTRDANALVLQTTAAPGDSAPRSVHWVNLATGARTAIWSSGADAPARRANGFVFDADNNQLAFMVENSPNPQAGRSIWYYKVGAERATLLADNQSVGIDPGLQIERGRYWQFSQDGHRLLFGLSAPSGPKPKADAVKVDVWSYRDPKLQSLQLLELDSTFNRLSYKGYTAVIDIPDRRITQLTHAHETLAVDEKQDDIAILTHRVGDENEDHWNATARVSTYLVSLKSGERKRLDGASSLWGRGNYAVFSDSSRRNIFSYDMSSGLTRNLTQSLPIPLVDREYDANARPAPRGISGGAWFDDGSAVVIQDRFDLWQLDPAGKVPSISLTNGYGRRHNIVFRLANWARYSGRRQAIANNAIVLLEAFDRSTKRSGYYRIVLGRSADPERLSMGPYTYEMNSTVPLKTKDGDVYLMQRSSAAESPNYFTTPDFKAFTPLTAVYPEAAYNWLRSEVITWKAFDGRVDQGALYKPENFDAKKKYPVIIHYYEKLSDKLNEYKPPEATANHINIPWFVSRGYVVLTPDIHYKIGYPGESAYNSVVSAAKYLARLPWVESTRIGIQGHSWGGFETNYLVTHTNVFAAAMSSSGISDIVSEYGAVALGHGFAKQYFYEVHQSRIGPTLWQRPDLYIKNSPVFRADKVTTPLLMMSNKEDGIVPFAQGVELFVALRRLGKRAWMLQYDGQRHGLDGAPALQHTIRVTQFFDHYLKGAPAPKWMTEGVPARLKGIETGLELNTPGKTPGAGLLLDTHRRTSSAHFPSAQ